MDGGKSEKVTKIGVKKSEKVTKTTSKNWKKSQKLVKKTGKSHENGLDFMEKVYFCSMKI
jgi:hypothetical protein